MTKINFHIRFELNGHEYNIKDSIDKFEWSREISNSYMKLGNEHIFKIFHKYLSEIIAKELMMQSPDFMRNFKI